MANAYKCYKIYFHLSRRRARCIPVCQCKHFSNRPLECCGPWWFQRWQLGKNHPENSPKIASTSKIDTFRRRFHRQCFHCHHANIINNHPQIHRIWIGASPKGETIWVSKYWHFIEKIGKIKKDITMSLFVSLSIPVLFIVMVCDR